MKFFGFILLILILFTRTIDLLSQSPVANRPQSSLLIPNVIIGNPDIRQSPALNNLQNQRQLNMYELDRMEVQRRNTEIQQKINQNNISNQSIHYNLPPKMKSQGAEHYIEAFKKLIDMLNETIPISLKDAVYLVENAYFEGQLEKSKYDKAIRNLGTIAHQKALQEKYNWNNPVTKNIMLFRVMSDTLRIKVPSSENYTTSYPMQYNFDDFKGEKDWTKMFVSRLLATNKGQCHSLPLLYLILCEAVGSEASLVYSPSHSYVKMKDQTGNWYNLELTNGRIVTDAFIAGSGFITAESIKNRTYMEAQTKQQTIAQCLSDLAMGYIHKYGYDDFVNQYADSILKYDPKNLSGLMIKAGYETVRFEYVVNQVGRPHPDSLKIHYPKIYKLLDKRNRTYRKIDETGFREMPKEAYEYWLNSVNEEKERREHEEKYNKVIQFTR